MSAQRPAGCRALILSLEGQRGGGEPRSPPPMARVGVGVGVGGLGARAAAVIGGGTRSEGARILSMRPEGNMRTQPSMGRRATSSSSAVRIESERRWRASDEPRSIELGARLLGRRPCAQQRPAAAEARCEVDEARVRHIRARRAVAKRGERERRRAGVRRAQGGRLVLKERAASVPATAEAHPALTLLSAEEHLRLGGGVGAPERVAR